MLKSVRVPYLSYEDIGRISRDFLSSHGYDHQIPIDVEALLEFVLDVSIIPIPGFQQNHGVEGSLSLDMRTVFVDEYVYRAVENRYRFTLAHELGHILLHQGLFKGIKISSIHEWKRAYKTIDESTYSALEKQAYDFAGLILVPSEDLRTRFVRLAAENKAQFTQAEGKGISLEKSLDYFKAIAIHKLARMFKVSPDVMERRIDKDDLVRQLRVKS